MQLSCAVKQRRCKSRAVSVADDEALGHCAASTFSILLLGNAAGLYPCSIKANPLGPFLQEEILELLVDDALSCTHGVSALSVKQSEKLIEVMVM